MRGYFGAVAALVVLLGGQAQAQNAPGAQRVIDRAQAAMGGARAWNGLRGLHETGEEGGVKFERWLDPLRYGLRKETHTSAGKVTQGYNGAAEWRVLASGVATGSVERQVVGKVRSEAFFGAYGYFFPSRFDLRSVPVGERQSQGKTYDVLKVQPAGGAPRELWFDRKTGLLGLMIEEGAAPGERPLTTEVLDYRKVGSITLPHRFVTYGGKLTAPLERKVNAVDVQPADRMQFSLPPPSGTSPLPKS